jgi:ribosomal-protein-alanine N-acetyltransferase
MILRDYRPEDFAHLCAIERLCFPPGLAYTTEEMRLCVEDRRSFTIVAEGTEHEIVGFLIARLEAERVLGERARERIGHLVTIDVHPDWQGRGIGSLLLQEAERRLRHAGARAVVLETAVDNIRAIRFYTRHGYEPLVRMKGYYLGQKDAVRMMKVLDAPRARP